VGDAGRCIRVLGFCDMRGSLPPPSLLLVHATMKLTLAEADIPWFPSPAPLPVPLSAESYRVIVCTCAAAGKQQGRMCSACGGPGCSVG